MNTMQGINEDIIALQHRNQEITLIYVHNDFSYSHYTTYLHKS